MNDCEFALAKQSRKRTIKGDDNDDNDQSKKSNISPDNCRKGN